MLTTNTMETNRNTFQSDSLPSAPSRELAMTPTDCNDSGGGSWIEADACMMGVRKCSMLLKLLCGYEFVSFEHSARDGSLKECVLRGDETKDIMSYLVVIGEVLPKEDSHLRVRLSGTDEGTRETLEKVHEVLVQALW